MDDVSEGELETVERIQTIDSMHADLCVTTEGGSTSLCDVMGYLQVHMSSPSIARDQYGPEENITAGIST